MPAIAAPGSDCVSTVTLALIPVRKSGNVSSLSSAMRTGMRCVTFTQLPVAFCAGISENSAPVPAPMAVTWALKSRPG